MNLTDLRGELLRSLRLLRIQLNEKIAKLADAIAAVNNKTQRFTTTIGPLGIGAHDVLITWERPWPDTGYGVLIEPITGQAAIGQVHASLKPGTKTTTQCEVTVVVAVAVASVGVDVVGIRT